MSINKTSSKGSGNESARGQSAPQGTQGGPRATPRPEPRDANGAVQRAEGEGMVVHPENDPKADSAPKKSPARDSDPSSEKSAKKPATLVAGTEAHKKEKPNKHARHV